MRWWDALIETVGNERAVANARILLDVQRQEELQVAALARRVEQTTTAEPRAEPAVSPAA